MPGARAPQTPEVVRPVSAFTQALQVPVHASLQQTPSAQNPIKHSSPAPHASPVAFFAMHTPVEAPPAIWQ
jgi:hypothetical protein